MMTAFAWAHYPAIRITTWWWLQLTSDKYSNLWGSLTRSGNTWRDGSSQVPNDGWFHYWPPRQVMWQKGQLTLAHRRWVVVVNVVTYQSEMSTIGNMYMYLSSLFNSNRKRQWVSPIFVRVFGKENLQSRKNLECTGTAILNQNLPNFQRVLIGNCNYKYYGWLKYL